MREVWELSWKLWPCLVVMETGALMAVRGLVLACRGAWMPLQTPGKNLTWMRGFRLTVLGLSVLGVGAAWLWQLPWLLALALVVGFEETVETSIAAWALKQEYEADSARDSRNEHRPTRGRGAPGRGPRRRASGRDGRGVPVQAGGRSTAPRGALRSTAR